MKNLITRFIREEEGQDLVEYALLLTLISLAVVSAIIALGGAVGDIFSEVTTSLG